MAHKVCPRDSESEKQPHATSDNVRYVKLIQENGRFPMGDKNHPGDCCTDDLI